MARSLEELEAEALNLPRPERARLAEVLISSLDEDAAIEEAWREEIRRRVSELREGSVETVPAEEVFQELDELTG
jgi:putative addiction module component (TIGR02574 family)